MKNNIMKTINNMYKSTPTLEESELLKLDSLLTKVGGNAKNILLSAEEHTMADFIDTCIRNGVTFELRKSNKENDRLSETAPVSNNNTSPIQSPSEKEKSCEEGCERAESPLTRITLDNWKELLSVGDTVVAIDDEGGKSFHTIADLDVEDDTCFMELATHWVHFGEDNTCGDGREYYVEG